MFILTTSVFDDPEATAVSSSQTPLPLTISITDAAGNPAAIGTPGNYTKGTYLITYSATEGDQTVFVQRSLTISDKPLLSAQYLAVKQLIYTAFDVSSWISIDTSLVDGDQLFFNLVVPTDPHDPQYDYSEDAKEHTIIYQVLDTLGNVVQQREIALTIFQFTDVSAGYLHTLALTSTNEVYSWGNGGGGRLGLDSTSSYSTPQRITSFDTVLATNETILKIIAASNTSYAVTSLGNIFSWGQGGTTGSGSSSNRFVPAKITLPTVGSNSEPLILKDFQIKERTAFALFENGDLYSWGTNDFQASGSGSSNVIPATVNLNSTTALTNVESIHIGEYHSFAITNNGGSKTLYGWGSNDQNELLITPHNNFTYATDITAGFLSYFGQDFFTQLKFLEAGYSQTMVVTTNNEIYTWGWSDSGRLGRPITSIPAQTPGPVANQAALIAGKDIIYA